MLHIHLIQRPPENDNNKKSAYATEGLSWLFSDTYLLPVSRVINYQSLEFSVLCMMCAGMYTRRHLWGSGL